MAKPQQPEIGRSRKTPSQDPDSTAAVLEGSRPLGDDGGRGPVPPENQPGHHPPHEQDQPDLDAFAERLGAAPATAGPAGRDAPGRDGPGPDAAGSDAPGPDAGGSDAPGSEAAGRDAGGSDAAAEAPPLRRVGRAGAGRVAAAVSAALALLLLGRMVKRRRLPA